MSYVKKSMGSEPKSQKYANFHNPMISRGRKTFEDGNAFPEEEDDQEMILGHESPDFDVPTLRYKCNSLESLSTINDEGGNPPSRTAESYRSTREKPISNGKIVKQVIGSLSPFPKRKHGQNSPTTPTNEPLWPQSMSTFDRGVSSTADQSLTPMDEDTIASLRMEYKLKQQALQRQQRDSITSMIGDFTRSPSISVDAGNTDEDIEPLPILHPSGNFISLLDGKQEEVSV